MPVLTALATAFSTISLSTAVSAATSAAAIGASVYGSQKQSQASKQIAAESARAEEIRRRQMLQEQARRQREIFRQSQLARATAVSNAANQGALEGSGLQGGLGQIAAETGQQTVALSENTDNSSQLFDANANIARFQGQQAEGRAISNLGTTITSVRPELDRIGTQLFDGYGKQGQ